MCQNSTASPSPKQTSEQEQKEMSHALLSLLQYTIISFNSAHFQMLSGTFASAANQVSRNRKDSQYMSAGFEHSGHFKGYLLSLKNLLVILLRKKWLTTDWQWVLLRSNYYFQVSVYHLPSTSTQKFWFSLLIQIFHTAIWKQQNKARKYWARYQQGGSGKQFSPWDVHWG